MQIDHLVWYCSDLDEGRRHFTSIMDNAPIYGGVHPGEGTRNSLLSLSNGTYVELLARDPAQPASALDPEIRALKGSGLYHWAMAGTDLSRLRGKARAAGLDAGELTKGGRTLPSGDSLSWTCLGIRSHGFGAQVPFFIDWMESHHPALTAPRGGCLAHMKVVSPEAGRLRDLYGILGIEIPVAQGARPSLSAILETQSGRHELGMFDPVPRGYVI